jgi:endonuclease/exonuclease/phosphatase family metal-dependent hydrolase
MALWRTIPTLLVALGTTGALLVAPAASAEPAVTAAVPVLEHAHAHNDEMRPDGRLLEGALSLGFNSVEVDVWLRNGLFVLGHDEPDPGFTKTLEEYYLAPLKLRVGSGGQVHQGATKPFTLVVEIKNPSDEAYLKLESDIKARYSTMVQRWANGNLVPGAVRIVLTATPPRDLIAGQSTRYMFFDAGDPAAYPGSAMPVVNREWGTVVAWDGVKPVTRAFLDQLSGAAVAAHRQGRELRLWGTPQTEATWLASLQTGVDFIEADDTAALHRLLTEHSDGKAFKTSTRGSASTVRISYDVQGRPVVSGVLTDIEAEGTCASVTINYELWNTANELPTTKSTCDNTSLPWSVPAPSPPAIYRYARVTVTGVVAPPVTSYYAVTKVLSTQVGKPGWSDFARVGGVLVGGVGASRLEQAWLSTYVRGTDNKLYETIYHPISGGWGPFKVLPGGTLTSDPTAVFEGDPEGFNSRQHVFYRDAAGAVGHRYQDDSFVWREASLGGSIIGAPAAVSWGEGHLVVFALGADRTLFHRTYLNGTWAAWTRVSTETWTADPAAVTVADGRIDVILRGNDGQLYQKTKTATTAWPATSKVLSGVVTGGAGVAGAWNEGRLDVFARSATGSLLQRTYTIAGGWTTSYVDLGGYVTADPEAVSWGPGRIDVIARGGVDNSMWHRSYRDQFGPANVRTVQFNVQGFVANAGSTAAVNALADNVIAAVRARNADMVALNELCYNHFHRIREALTANGEYVAYDNLQAFDKLATKPACGDAFGNALFVKAATLGGPEHLALTRQLSVPPGETEPRSLICLMQPKRTTLFCGTHLQSGTTAAAVAARNASIATINTTLGNFTKAGWQVVLAGDLNADPNDNEMDALYEPRYGTGAVGDYREAVSTRGGADTTNGHKYDYVLVNRHVTDVGPPRVTDVAYSDHHIYENTVTLK